MLVEEAISRIKAANWTGTLIDGTEARFSRCNPPATMCITLGA
jgi:hypothetical protein